MHDGQDTHDGTMWYSPIWAPLRICLSFPFCEPHSLLKGREREREREREKEGEGEGQTDRQTDTQTNRQTDKQTDRHSERQTDKQTNRQTDRQGEKSETTKNVFGTDLTSSCSWGREKMRVLRAVCCRWLQAAMSLAAVRGGTRRVPWKQMELALPSKTSRCGIYGGLGAYCPPHARPNLQRLFRRCSSSSRLSFWCWWWLCPCLARSFFASLGSRSFAPHPRTIRGSFPRCGS